MFEHWLTLRARWSFYLEMKACIDSSQIVAGTFSFPKKAHPSRRRPKASRRSVICSSSDISSSLSSSYLSFSALLSVHCACSREFFFQEFLFQAKATVRFVYRINPMRETLPSERGGGMGKKINPVIV